MLKNKLIYSLVLVSLVACHPVPGKRFQLRDSALAQHFKLLEKLPHKDTTTIESKLLRAAYLNDTNYFLNYFKEIPEEEFSSRTSLYSDSCLHLTDLSLLGVDEAYRINAEYYGMQLLLNGVLANLSSVTISRIGDDVRIQTIRAVYEPDDPDGRRFKVFIGYRQDTALALADWNRLQKELTYCDFWGLKTYNEFSGKDGYAVTIDGYKKHFMNGPPRHHHVYRWAIHESAIFTTYRLAMKLSGARNRPFD